MKEQRKIFNFKSEILRDMTLEKEGYFPEVLGKTSTKFIWATCRFCGEPHRIRNGFFNKAESACHKQCKLKEQGSFCPFNNPEKLEKAKKTNLIKYGFEFASQNKNISNKISKTKLTKESQQKTKNTNLEKYNVENVFQNELIKEKIKETNIERYGVDNPLKSEIVKEKSKSTCIDRYGVENPMFVDFFKQKAIDNFNDNVKENKNGNYDTINCLRSEEFWEKIRSGTSLSEICFDFNLEYQTTASTLSRPEFKDKFQNEYSFPKNQAQKSIKDKICSLGFTCTMNDRSAISPLELDIYVPDKKFAIEYNGSYWHSEAVLDPKEAIKKHITKTKMCEAKGIRLFHIFEHEWEGREDRFLNFIKTILGSNNINIGARKCDIEIFNKCELSKNFIQNNHIQGYGVGTIKFFNLVHESQILASMTASKHHRQNIEGNPIVLNRLCFRNDYNIQGGSSKLFSSFVKWAKDSGYDRILSWSDNRWTEGNIYKVLGFNLIKNYEPDYFYYDSVKRKYTSKQSQKKSNTGCPEEITERDWCYEKGLFRIWDCGKKLWEYRV